MKLLKATVTILFIISIEASTDLDYMVYKNDSLLYTANYDIIDIHSSMIDTEVVFIVERQLPNGDYKGLYTLERNDTDRKIYATKVLDNGRCTTSDNETVFFGASDGIYTFNYDTKKAERYGNITADVRAIQKHTNKDVIYVITDNQLSTITERGTKIKKVESVNNAQEVVLDKDNNVYFYEKRVGSSEDKYSKPKVIVDGKITDVTGLPDEFNQIKLTRALASSEGAILVLDNRVYRIFPNGTIVDPDLIFKNVPTSYYLDLGLVQLYGHGRKLYNFSILDLIFRGVSSAISDFFRSI